LSVVDLLLLLLSKDFVSGHFKKFEISFRALKPRPAHHGGQAVRSPEFAPETPNPFASRQPRHSRSATAATAGAQDEASRNANAATASSRKMTARNRPYPAGWRSLGRIVPMFETASEKMPG